MKRYFSWALAISIGLLTSLTSTAQTVPLGEPTTLRAQTTEAQTYEWTFPGGVVINGEVVQYTFNEPGPQEVQLKVTDFEGNTNEITKRILVANQGRPTAVINSTVNGESVTGDIIEAFLGDSISFESASFAPDKSADDFNNTWSVNGRNYSESVLNSVFDKIGTYSVSLTVKDPVNGNQEDSSTVQLKIVNQPPEVSGIEISNVNATGEQVQVKALAEDPDGTISSYKFEALEAGQSLITQVVSSDTTVFDLSRIPGAHDYNFRVTVSDDRFLSTDYTSSEIVSVDPISTNSAPEVEMLLTPGNQGYVDDPFEFKAEASDADGDSLRYEWISSDGRVYSGTQFQKIYFTPGTYNMTLKVSDGLETTTESLDITIQAKPEVVIENAAPEIEIYGILPGTTAPMNELFRFYLNASDADQDRLTYEWDFGNGTKSFTQNAAILYNQPGQYTVEVSVSDGTDTVTDSVNITVELGPKEVYLETAEDRLVDIQAEQQQLLALIEANGGELTEAQEAQLEALNDDIEDLIAEAQLYGDFEAIAELERMQAALNRSIGPIESVVADGKTLEELAEELETEQTEQINTYVETAQTLENQNQERAALQAEEVETEIEAAIAESEVVFAQIEASRTAIMQQKEQARADLEAAYETGNQANIDLAKAEYDRIEALLASADERSNEIEEEIRQAQQKVRNQKEQAKADLEAAVEAGDEANAILAQTEIDRLDDLLEESQRQQLLTTEKISAARLQLEEDKAQAKADVQAAISTGNSENQALAEQRLDEIEAQIREAEAQSLVVFQEIETSQDRIRALKEQAKRDLEQARISGNEENTALADAELDRLNLQLKESEEKLSEIQNEIILNRSNLVADKEAAREALLAARESGDAANQALADQEIDRINDLLENSADELLEIQSVIEESRNDLRADKEAAKAALKLAKTNGDAENQALAQAQLNQINRRLDKSAEDLATLQAGIVAMKDDIRADKQIAIENLRAAKAAGDAENEALAEEQLAQLRERDAEAADKLADIQTSILEQREQLKADKQAAVEAVNEAFATGNAENIALAQAELERVRNRSQAAKNDTLSINQDINDSRKQLKLDKDFLIAELAAARAAGDADNAALAQAELVRINALLQAAEADTLALNEEIQTMRAETRAELAVLITEREAYRAAGDADNAALAQAQIEATQAMITASNQAVLAQQNKIQSLREDLVDQQQTLIDERKAYRAAGDAINANIADEQLAALNIRLEAAQTATLELNEAINVVRSEAEQEQADLISQIQNYQATQDQANLNRAQARLEVVNETIAEANKATVELLADIAQMRTDLELEQSQLRADLEAYREANDAENVRRIQGRLNEVDAMIAAATAESEAIEQAIAEKRTALENRRNALISELAAARKANSQANIERAEQQLADTDYLIASLSGLDVAAYYEQQTKNYETNLKANKVLLAELEAAKAQGLSPEEYLASLQAQAAATDVDSEAFQSAAVAIEQRERLQRADFLQQQIENLETLNQTPTQLPTLGVSRQSALSLPDRLNRLEDKAQRAAVEAAEREAAAVEIATLQREEKVAELARLKKELEAELDEARRQVIAARIGLVEKEIAELESLINPGSVLTQAEVEARIDELLAEVETLSSTVQTEQQAFISNRLSELQVEIDLASDPAVKERLEIEKRSLEASLGQEGILTNYEAQLKAQQKALNERLATDLSTTAERLVETQLESVETKLNNLTQLSAAQSEINAIDLDGDEDEALQVDAFLSTEKQALELERRALKAEISRTTDPIDKKALQQREAEIEAQLAAIPQTPMTLQGVEDLKVVAVVDYLTHYRNMQAQDMNVALNDENQETVKRLDSQIEALKRLNNFGYTPQTPLATIMVDLQRRESELLAEYREATGEKAENLKTRLVVLAQAIEQIEGLSDYEIPMNDSVYKANQKLDKTVEAARDMYFEAATPAQQLMARQSLESLRVSQRWLGRFYKPETRNQTLAELEAQLRDNIDNDSSASEVSDLVQIQSVKANLDKAVLAQFETDFENFKTNLQKQARQINDPDEKRAIEMRIKALESENLVETANLEQIEQYESLLADINIKVDTNLFLYADIPLTEYPEPLLFEWDLGDGEKRYGQNVNHEYIEPGFYRVVLTMFDGVTSEQDLFTIKVTE